jgi:hypothetical protein
VQVQKKVPWDWMDRIKGEFAEEDWFYQGKEKSWLLVLRSPREKLRRFHKILVRPTRATTPPIDRAKLVLCSSRKHARTHLRLGIGIDHVPESSPLDITWLGKMLFSLLIVA